MWDAIEDKLAAYEKLGSIAYLSTCAAFAHRHLNLLESEFFLNASDEMHFEALQAVAYQICKERIPAPNGILFWPHFRDGAGRLSWDFYLEDKFLFHLSADGKVRYSGYREEIIEVINTVPELRRLVFQELMKEEENK